MKQPVERRLAAILAADVAGYSRLVGADEEGTLAHLKAIRAEFVDPKIAASHGRVVKTTGDGLLVEFASVVDALRCATAVQAGMAEHNAAVAPDQRIEFRIGIHQGDIVVEDGDIFGDGVNVAARIEALAEPGGICVSSRVQEDAAGKLTLSFVDKGEQTLKNIARPVRVYAINASGAPVAAVRPPGSARRNASRRLATIAGSVAAVIGIGTAVWWAWPNQNSPTVATPAPAATSPQTTPVIASTTTPRLSIVVLPFTNLSNDPEQEYFVDAVTDGLTTDLSRIAGSFVIARNTAFTYKGKPTDVKQIGHDLGVRYVLEGSVRRLGDRVQVNVQLIDGESGVHVWADRFDTDRRNLAEAQSEITGRLARTLDLALVRDVTRRIEQANAADLGANDLVMRGRGFFPLGARPGRADALLVFEQALKLDPHSVDAKLGIATVLTADIINGFSSSIQQDEARAEQLLLEALEADRYRSWAHERMGVLRGQIQHRWAEGQSELEMAIALDRNNSNATRQLGQLLQFTGQPEAAIPYIEKSLRLNPREAAGLALGNLGSCYMDIGQVDKAIGLLRKAATENPKIFWFHLALAGALGLKGDIDEAKTEIAASLKVKPEINSIAAWRAWMASTGLDHPQFLALAEKSAFTGVRRAGFPEE